MYAMVTLILAMYLILDPRPVFWLVNVSIIRAGFSVPNAVLDMNKKSGVKTQMHVLFNVNVSIFGYV